MSTKTLRLHFPQRQGGNIEAYHFGSQLLSMLALATDGPVTTVDVTEPDGGKLALENGIIARSMLLRQLDSAVNILRQQAPDRIVVLGGDCLVDPAPFAYLNERYDGDLALLWVDAPSLTWSRLSRQLMRMPWCSATLWAKATRICRQGSAADKARQSHVCRSLRHVAGGMANR